MSSSRNLRSTQRTSPRVSLGQAREILGEGKLTTILPGQGGSNTSGTIGVAGDVPAGAHAVRLPAAWRSILGRASWFAAEHRKWTNESKSCIMLDGVDAYAGTFAGAISIPFDIGGIALPVFLPNEVAWHKIPGVDGAVLWQSDGKYTIQTDAGLRVQAARPTANLEEYPWKRFFEAYTEDDSPLVNVLGLQERKIQSYTRYALGDFGPWVEALEHTPSAVLEISTGVSEIYLRETRAQDSPWPLTCMSFSVVRAGHENERSTYVPAAHLLAAVKALAAENVDGVLAIRSPGDNVFLFAEDATAIVAPVAAVQPSVPRCDLVSPEPPTVKTMRTLRPTVQAGLGTLGG